MGGKLGKDQGDEQARDGIHKGAELKLDYSLFLGDYIKNRTMKFGDKVAQVDVKSGETLTYTQLHAKSDLVRFALQNRDMYQESVAIASHNCVEYVWVLFGAMKAKSCSVLLNPDYTPREIKHNFSISKPKLVICSQTVAEFKHSNGQSTAQVFAAEESVSEIWIWGVAEKVSLPEKCKSLESVLSAVVVPDETEAPYSPVRDTDSTILVSPIANEKVGGMKTSLKALGDMDATIIAADGILSPVKEAGKNGLYEEALGSNDDNVVSGMSDDFEKIVKIDDGEEDLGAPKSLVALILSSSGSTGLPKGVMLSHLSVIAALETGAAYAKLDDTSLGLMPFFHAYGLILMLMCLCEGACIVAMPKFTVEEFFKVIQEHKVNNLYLVPSLLALLSKNRRLHEAELSSVRHIWTGAAPMSRKLQEAMSRRFDSSAMLHHSYGLTETTFTMFSGECQLDRPGSPGKTTPGIECKVIDAEGELLGPNTAGELCFRGPLLMIGYKDNTAATKEMIDQDGWIHSGDLGYFDADGYFYIVDRLKELIKYQGHQVAPSELEAILMTHPEVKDVAVLGIPHEVFGELAQALVVLQDGANVGQVEIQDFLAVEVSPQKRLHGGVRFVDVIPKTPNGKILRRELKDLYLKE